MYKGIILAGGKGTRLYPSSRVVSKQLMNVYDKPLIYYPLSTLMLAGIKNILIITNLGQVDQFQNLLGDGSQWGISISYETQENPNGLPEAFLIAEDFIGDDNVCLILGDNLLYGNSLNEILKDCQTGKGSTVLSYPVKDPERYGVVEYDLNENVIGFEEKPEVPKSNRALIGVYFFDNRCVSFSKELKPSSRGETEIIDLLNKYLNLGDLKVKGLTRTMTWIDAGTFDSLLLASNFIATVEKVQSYKISCPEEVAYKNRWINGKQLLKLSEDNCKSGYGDYLKSIIEDY
jgi:glucose-1-phosphate thymidylyltransferase